MNRFFSNQLFFEQQLYPSNYYCSMYPWYPLQQSLIPPFYYSHQQGPYIQQTCIPSQSQRMQTVKSEMQLNALLHTQQKTEQSILEIHQSTLSELPQSPDSRLSLQTVEKYIILVIDEDDYASTLVRQLKKDNQEKLADVLESIARKQKHSAKSREELIKYCLRKALKYTFKKMQMENGKTMGNLKTAQKLFSETIFGETNATEILPFKKNSRNKTMNQDFLKEIFSSQSFLKHYKEFLDQFDDVMQRDKQQKIASLCNKVWEYISEDQAKFNIKRLPWSQRIIDKAKQTATQLLTQQKCQNV